MEELHSRHRQEQRDLQARITQKKKSATKKTRKGVNDECAELERQLQERHNAEVLGLAPITDPSDSKVQDRTSNGEDEPTVSRSGIGIKAISQKQAHPGAIDKEDGPVKKPNRQKARLARRAAEQEAATADAAKEAEQVPDLRTKEIEAMRQEYVKRGLKEQPIRSDGHCLYAAVADQLTDNDLGLQPEISINGLELGDLDSKMIYKATRQVAASYIAANADDFIPFLDESLDTYCQTIRDTGEWGGHLELLALARAYAVDINILQGDGKVEKIECGSATSHSLWLAYYRHSFGLGEHYNSLRRALR